MPRRMLTNPPYVGIEINVDKAEGLHSAGPAALLPVRSTHASSRFASPALEANFKDSECLGECMPLRKLEKA